MRIGIQVLKFTVELERKLHGVAYLQHSLDIPHLSSILEFTFEQDSVFIVQEVPPPSSSSSPSSTTLMQEVVGKNTESFTDLLLDLVYILHSYGVFGLDFSTFTHETTTAFTACKAADCGKFKFFDYLIFDGRQGDEFQDLKMIGDKLEMLDRIADDSLLSDLKSLQLSIFQIFKKHNKTPPLFPPAPLTISPQLKLYESWKRSGRNALKEFFRVNKREFYPILNLPKTSNTHAETSSFTQIFKSVNIEIAPSLLESVDLSHTDDTLPSPLLESNRPYLWFQALNSIKTVSLHYILLQYDQAQKYDSNHELDRQLDVDLPRCHSYNSRISSETGQYKLKRLIKALFQLRGNEKLVYWQGLDSIAATFLSVFFYQDHLALFCLDVFLNNYLMHFFIDDNSQVIQAYLETFQALTAFFDPCLSCHLADIGYWPDLFAIPWFLTFFTHVLSMKQIVELYDAVLDTNPAAMNEKLVSKDDESKNLPLPRVLSLFIALSILNYLRPLILNADFQECVHLFSEMNFQKSMVEILEFGKGYLKLTPPSFFSSIRLLDFPSESSSDRRPSIFGNGKARTVSICLEDYLSLSFAVPIDIRAAEKFREGHLKGVIVYSCWLDMPQEVAFEKFSVLKQVAESFKGDQFYCIITGDEEGIVEAQVALLLVRLGIPGVAVLKGGFEKIKAQKMDIVCTCSGNHLPDGTLACSQRA